MTQVDPPVAAIIDRIIGRSTPLRVRTLDAMSDGLMPEVHKLAPTPCVLRDADARHGGSAMLDAMEAAA